MIPTCSGRWGPSLSPSSEPPGRPLPASGQGLAPRLPVLTHLLRAFGIAQAEVQRLDRPPQEGPPPRPVLHDNTLLLPEASPGWLAPADDLYLAATLHAIGHWLHSPRRQAVGQRKPVTLALAAALEDVRVDRLMMQRYPGMARLYLRLVRSQPALPSVGFGALIARLQRVLLDAAAHDDDAWVCKGRRLFEAEAQRLADPDALRGMVSVLANDLGQLRVRMNLQTHAPAWPWHDDNSHLWAHPADADHAQASVRLSPSASPGEAGPVEQGAAADEADPGEVAPVAEAACFEYPEWHYRLQRARTRWCTVREQVPPSPPANPSSPLPSARRLHLSRRPRLDPGVRLRRQQEGEELDLDAAAEFMIDRRLGLLPEPRLYRRAGHSTRSASILLLLDLSASTRDRLPGGRSILELEHEAAGLLMEALRASADRLEIAGFDSNGRHQVNYLRLLDFGQPVPARPAALLAFARSGRSTRMGAALRHAVARLAQERSETRVLILLSDGEPSDIDVFDDRQLLEDAAMAVRDARRQGIRCFCLTHDPQAASSARRIFGHDGYRIVDDPERLPEALARCHQRLVDGG